MNILLLLFTCILAAALFFNLLWASISSSITPNWPSNQPHRVVIANYSINVENIKKVEIKEKKANGESISPTFADLPAPELQWEKMTSAPVPRYIYVISGQRGPQCRGPTAQNFVLDTKTKKWTSMPPLPAPRYAPATQLWKGRLHVMGGSKENRHTPGVDHWSLAVKNGKALEKQWLLETPIPRGGPHRACVALDDGVIVIGGQEGDFMAKPGSPIFKCSRRHEVVYPDVYKLDAEMKWEVLPPMPKPDSHIESSWVVVNNSIILIGGTTEKHPVTKRMILVGEVFQFHLDSKKWSVIGKLPFRCKTTLAAFWDGWLYFTSGQRDRGPDNPQPRKVIGEMWRTKLSLSQ
ncbi:kelch repeat-containing protein At3g27220 isoform X2 [Daucus carota subsp. sativus]|uniref:kelch repeat-containing protein At3g27220 isoform X2 n=1 Tax=Daucus carota subsp. sativus TaxID=79200 RepID=UPI0030830411